MSDGRHGASLSSLERDGLVVRHAHEPIRRRVDDRLNSRGVELITLLAPWADRAVQQAEAVRKGPAWAHGGH